MKLQIDCHKKVGKFNLRWEKSPFCLKQTEAFSFKPPEYKLLTVVGVNCFALNEPSGAAQQKKERLYYLGQLNKLYESKK